jgi:choline dehydrogenase-like flavoprotein
MDIPVLAMFLHLSGANWNYKGVPSNKTCLVIKNRQCMFPHGKVMGGSSVLNFMVHTRGNRKDYDLWEVMRNTDWGYEGVLSYFLKSEYMDIPELVDCKNCDSTDGYLTISYSSLHTPLAEAFLEAGEKTGYEIID